MCDERSLYVEIYAYDSEPEKITRIFLERDLPIPDDDAIRVIIDSFGTFRDAYFFFFAVNPNGAKNDRLIENNSTVYIAWNSIWDAAARVAEDGWWRNSRSPSSRFRSTLRSTTGVCRSCVRSAARRRISAGRASTARDRLSM